MPQNSRGRGVCYPKHMRNLAAVIIIAVCAVSVGINTYQQKWFLAVCYLGALWFFWWVIEKSNE